MKPSPPFPAIHNNYFKPILFATVIVGVLLLMVWARAFYGSMQAFREGEACLNAGRLVEAITCFDRSIHWYTPFNPYVRRSAERLWKISEDAEKKGDQRLALIALRAIRRGFMGAVSFYTPGKEWIEKTDARIDELLRMTQDRRGRPEGGDGREIRLPDSLRPTGPDPLWSIVLLAGFLGWTGSVIAFILSRVRSDGGSSLLSFQTLRWILIWACCFSAWIVGMMKA